MYANNNKKKYFLLIFKVNQTQVNDSFFSTKKKEFHRNNQRLQGSTIEFIKEQKRTKPKYMGTIKELSEN